jgi:hypothetical protein
MLKNWLVIVGWKNLVFNHIQGMCCDEENQYEEHSKHIFPMTQTKLFNKFKEEHKEVKISINTFVQQKPWFVRPITVCDMCCCRYHVEFELHYDTFFGFW